MLFVSLSFPILAEHVTITLNSLSSIRSVQHGSISEGTARYNAAYAWYGQARQSKMGLLHRYTRLITY